MNDGSLLFFGMIFGCIAGLFLGFALFFDSPIYNESIEKAIQVCTSNDGVKWVDRNRAECNNGAKFEW